MNKRERVYSITKGRCFYCGCPISLDDFHIEHAIPKKLGGGNGANLVPSCADCNLFKGDLNIEGFRAKLKEAKNTGIGLMLSKYYGIPEREIVFYFEKVETEAGASGNL